MDENISLYADDDGVKISEIPAERTSPADDDLFIIEDNEKDEFKLKFGTIKNTLIGGSVAAGNNKAVTGDSVNGAYWCFSELSNYQ